MTAIRCDDHIAPLRDGTRHSMPPDRRPQLCMHVFDAALCSRVACCFNSLGSIPVNSTPPPEGASHSSHLLVFAQRSCSIGSSSRYMPLIVISGLPCSGKSTVAATLADLCRQLGQEVQIVDEDSLHLQRNDSYKGGDPPCCSGGRRQPALPDVHPRPAVASRQEPFMPR